MKKFLLSVLLAAGCVALHAETPMVRKPGSKAATSPVS